MGMKDAFEAKGTSRPPISRLRKERELRGWTQSELAEHIGTTQINISRWENGVTIPGPYYRQRLSKLFKLSIQELGFIPDIHEEPAERADSAPAPPDSHHAPIWTVPYRRNPFFTGREEILSHVYTLLKNRKSAALTQAQAISGLGGIGKTQIAIEYAYRYRDRYEAVLWINASSHEAFIADYVMLVALLGLPEQHEQDQEIVIRAVKHWFATHNNWLLILDNVDDPQLVAHFLPMDSTGDVLLTTRLQALGTVAQSIEVEKMGLEEGVMFLLRRTKMLTLDTPPHEGTQELWKQAAEIVTALDGLPLALDQAGAYIEETRCGLAQYLMLYRTRRKELLLRRGRYPIDHPDSIAATWALSFHQVELESKAAADLLRLLAFLDPEAIPEEVVTQGAMDPGPVPAEVANDPLKVNEIIEILLRYSLIRRSSEVKVLSIHRLVQAVLKDGMDRDTQRLWAERAIRVVNSIFPDVTLETWQRCQRCLPHVQVCAPYIEHYDLAFPEAARLFNEVAAYLVAHAHYEQAEFFLQKALAIRRHVLPPDHPDTARTLNDLGVLYLTQSSYAQAEPLLEQALVIRRQQLGAEHPDTATSLSNQALLYYEQGRYPLAEQLYQEALAIRRRVLQSHHPDIAQSLDHLARLYTVLGEFSQAQSLYEEALRNQQNTLGLEHPLVAKTLNNMALLYRSKGEYKQAEQYYEQALFIQEKVLGSNHPDVAETLNNLARLFRAKGAYEKAEPLYQRALHIREASFGPEHPLIAHSFYGMAKLYHSQGKYAEAEQMCKDALRIQEQRLGANHPTVAYTLVLLAKIYQAQQKLQQAEELNMRALWIRELTLGADHPNIAVITNNLAEIYHAGGRYRDAEPLIARSLTLHERALGSEHPYIAYSLSNRADNLFFQGKYTEAEAYYQQAIAIREQNLGTKHPRTAAVYQKLARLYAAESRYEEAEVLYLKALAIRERIPGTNDASLLDIFEQYADLLHKMKKDQQAYELEKKARNLGGKQAE